MSKECPQQLTWLGYTWGAARGASTKQIFQPKLNLFR